VKEPHTVLHQSKFMET